MVHLEDNEHSIDSRTQSDTCISKTQITLAALPSYEFSRKLIVRIAISDFISIDMLSCFQYYIATNQVEDVKN